MNPLNLPADATVDAVHVADAAVDDPALVLAETSSGWDAVPALAGLAGDELTTAADRVAAAWTGPCSGDDLALMTDLFETAGVRGLVSLLWNGGDMSRRVAALLATTAFFEQAAADICATTRYKRKDVLRTVEQIDDLVLDGALDAATEKATEALSNLSASVSKTIRNNKHAHDLKGASDVVLRSTAALQRSLTA